MLLIPLCALGDAGATCIDLYLYLHHAFQAGMETGSWGWGWGQNVLNNSGLWSFKVQSRLTQSYFLVLNFSC